MSLEHNPPIMELANKALQQAFWLLQQKKRLYSFVVWESDTEDGYEIFEVDDYDEGLSRAREYVRQLSDGVSRYALVYDGYLKLDGRRQDAVYLEVGESGSPQAMLFVQAYARRTLLRRTFLVGDLTYLEPIKTLLWSHEPARSSGVWASQ